MNFGFALLGGATAGAIGGLAAGAAIHSRIWSLRLNDAEALEQGRPLAPTREPPAKARKDRNIVLKYVISILGSGFAVWLAAFIALQFLLNLGTSTSSETVPALERIIGTGFFAVIFGLIGLLIPGAFIGVILHFAENRARLKAREAVLTRQYWEDRERLRHALEAGEITVPDAIQLLRGDATQTEPPALPPEPGVPVPEANQPITPTELFALTSSVARHGYVGVDAGVRSTVAVVTRILTDSYAVERGSITITPHDISEAENAFVWAMHAYDANPRDDFRIKVGDTAARKFIDPQDQKAVRTLAAGVGAYRRAMAHGNY